MLNSTNLILFIAKFSIKDILLNKLSNLDWMLVYNLFPKQEFRAERVIFIVWMPCRDLAPSESKKYPCEKKNKAAALSHP